MEIILGIACILLCVKWIVNLNKKDELNRLNNKIEQLEQKVEFLRNQVENLIPTKPDYATHNTAEIVEPAVDTAIWQNNEMPDEIVSGQTEIEQQSLAVTAQIADRAEIPQLVREDIPVPPISDEAPSVWQRQPSKPSSSASSMPPIVEKIRKWLITGNPMLKIGVVVLFLGLGFLLRFASEHFSFSVQARYFSVAAVGIACGVIGWRLRHRYREYGLTMQGASLAILYLTALATLKLHGLLPPWLVFAVQIGLVILMTFLAVIQDARILAQVALLGGLASPVLISDGSGNYIVLFGYLALLNSGVAAVAWFKSWRSLNIIGALGTFAIATGWGLNSYRPQYYLYCQLFLIFHTALYTFIVWRFALHKIAEARQFSPAIDNNATLDIVFAQWWRNMRHIGMLDSGLLFGVAFAAFMLQSAMADIWRHGVMWSALSFAAFYAGLGYWIRRSSPPLKLMAEALFLLALVFVTLAIGDSFDGWQRTTLWAVEGVLLYWFGLRQFSPFSRFLALNLLIGAWLLYGLYITDFEADTLYYGIAPIGLSATNYSLLNVLFLVLSGAWVCWLWQRLRAGESAPWEKIYAAFVLILTLFSAFMIPFFEYQIQRLDNHHSLMSALAIILLYTVIQQRKENVVMAFATVVGLTMAVYQYDFSPFWFNFMCYSLTAGFSAWSLHHPHWLKEDGKTPIEYLLGYVALTFSIIAFCGMLIEAELFNRLTDLESFGYVFITTFSVVALLAYSLRWQQANMAALAFLPVWALLSAAGIMLVNVRFSYFILFTCAALLHAFILFGHSRLKNTTRILWHTAGFNLFVLDFIWLCTDLAFSSHLTSGWYTAAMAVAPLSALGIVRLYRDKICQRGLQASYLGNGSLVIWHALALWAIGGNLHSSALASPLPYIPLLNPLELASLLFAYLFWQWGRDDKYLKPDYLLAAIGLFAWFMLSVIAMRVWHHYGDIEWRFAALVHSFAVQATLSVIWAVSAIILMLQGHRRTERKIWFAGAGLIGIVVLKLFLIELGDSGGIARIVSFIVVGILLLLVGYFAPIPPKRKQTTDSV